jgi:hypothetical protein
MPFRRILSFAAVALLASSCTDSPTVVQTPDSSVRVINAGGVPLNILIDGIATGQALGVANVSDAFSVRSGAHVIGLRANGVSTDINVQTTTGQTLTTVAVPSGSGLTASVLVDTGSIVPAGKSKLRVSHLAGGAPPMEIWRTQPDYQTPIHIMTPFAYQATSPYLQSDPGTWEVFVTAPGGGAKLATTGAINVPAGERRTVVLLDSLGVMRFRVIAE